MFIIGNFLNAIAMVLSFALQIYMYLVIARAVLSWVSPDPYNPIVRFIHNVTEPVMHRIRSKVPVHYGGIDFSPIIVFMIIIFLQQFLVGSLRGMAVAIMH
jgi:YggT family protein